MCDVESAIGTTRGIVLPAHEYVCAVHLREKRVHVIPSANSIIQYAMERQTLCKARQRVL